MIRIEILAGAEGGTMRTRGAAAFIGCAVVLGGMALLASNQVAAPILSSAVSSASMAGSQESATPGFTSYAVDLDRMAEAVASLPASEQAMLKRASEYGDYVNMFLGEDFAVLVQVGDVKLHPDPAADIDFIEGRSAEPDPLADKAYWEYVETGKIDDVPVVGPQVEVAR